MTHPPHVFVVQGDLTALACDAWLVPGGRGGPGLVWKKALEGKRRIRAPHEWGHEGVLRSRLYAEVLPDEPVPFLTNITGTNRAGPEWYVQGAVDFVSVAVDHLRAKRPAPLHGRARHLLALPLVGTGGGGGARYSGEVMRLLLPALQRAAQSSGQSGFPIDVALVLLEGPAWAAAQNERLVAGEPAWAALPPSLSSIADSLALRARRGDLVLFLGAGVSKPAGLPSWTDLLKALAVDRLPDTEVRELQDLSELDRAALIERRLRPGETLGEAVAQLFLRHSPRHALGHALLADLPVDEIVTTNYDALFERASAAVGRACKMIPGEPVARGERFILKMHGSVTRPSSIVLTREDYLKFQENRQALAGIVQALLLTRHMLFVGFGFTDDNFHRIAHAVRTALRGAQPLDEGEARFVREPFGTNLVVGQGTLVRELWKDDFNWVALGDIAPSMKEQARLVEIFLDRLAAKSATATAHLGDDRYEAVMSEGERRLRDRLLLLAKEASAAERGTAAWVEVELLLQRLGIGPARSPAED